MKITVYTTADCQFSKAEKEYLASHSLQYEEKNLETNKEFLTEMLAVSNNFAGTPVTRVEKDDGTIAVLKGFTKEEFDTTFGFTQAPSFASTPPEPSKTEEAKPEETPPAPTSTPQSTAAEPPKEEPKSDELNAVIDKLEEKTETPPTNPPTIPDFSSDIKTTA